MREEPLLESKMPVAVIQGEPWLITADAADRIKRV